MMARSTCSNQRPNTLMQDRICQVDETSCNARPDHTFGSKCEELEESTTSPLSLRNSPSKRTSPIGRNGPGADNHAANNSRMQRCLRDAKIAISSVCQAN